MAVTDSDRIGPDVTLLFGNTDGSWNDLSKILPGPPVTLNGPSVISYKSQDGSDRLRSDRSGRDSALRKYRWVVERPFKDFARSSGHFERAIGHLLQIAGWQ